MAKAIKTNLDFEGVSRLINLPNAIAAQEPMTLAQGQALSEGNSWKDSARVGTPGNVNLASPGALIDGITMANGDRVLVRNQTSQPQNGIYIWNGAATAMTRALDANTADELEMATLYVEEGTDAGARFRQQTLNFALDTDNVIWQSDTSIAPPASETTSGIAEIATQAETDAGTDDIRFVTPLKMKNYGGRVKKYATSIGDGAATSYTITHNLGTKDVSVSTFYNAGTFDEVFCDIQHTTINTLTLLFNVAPTTNQIRVVCTG